ncbi:hypothetical protein LJC68_04245 [Bacteroidales bacterium OttesenSCG-928-B11]|nr:hypothetical protein [Bacteroidales bacterium OttesenSCG-928-E04]MDL2309467.1 hypothetical protein [Bacteroidales bacterium OttesenSCG-928-C03]MDL2312070.1 hypothetical protein [Bacteroidales bacterium OttesenSCG-928-B11]MDL2325680.1 hypothetical protein [Bacteroidales bacterium OttesenSCG-928-A14]
MKKVFLALACVAFIATATSCKKNCICTASEGGISMDLSVGEMSKKDCEDLTSFTVAGVTVEVGDMYTCKPE